MSTRKSRLETLERLSAGQQSEGFDDDGVPLDFRFAGKSRLQLLEEFEGFTQQKLRDPQLSPERRKKLEAHLVFYTERSQQLKAAGKVN